MDQVLCDCGCGEAVGLELPGGFAGTTALLGACSQRRSAGLGSLVLRRSAALGLRSAGGPVRHRDGLVAFG
jgi:hypothetical protein